ncbi:hypothetical protein [Microbacterium sp. P5_E9]
MSQIGGIPGVRTVAGASPQPQDFGAAAVVYAANLETVRASVALLDEPFGPTTLLVEYESIDDALALAESLGGSLTATVHSETDEVTRTMADRLVGFAGRVLFAGWPTGVAVTWAQNHGGPWPASTSTDTSVGPTALRRFLRLVAYQSAPSELLPDELHDVNPLRIPRRVDGVLTR